MDGIINMKMKAKGSKKNRKFGRHAKRSPAADRYRAEHRWITNKIKKLVKHVKKKGINDKQAILALNSLKKSK